MARGLKPGQTHSGSFKPGQSGNPAGYPKQTVNWRKELREDEELHQAALDWAKSAEPKANPMLQFLLEQAHGKAKQTVDHQQGIDPAEFLEVVCEGCRAKILALDSGDDAAEQ